MRNTELILKTQYQAAWERDGEKHNTYSSNFCEKHGTNSQPADIKRQRKKEEKGSVVERRDGRATQTSGVVSQTRLPLQRESGDINPPAAKRRKDNRGGEDSSRTDFEMIDLKRTVLFLCARTPWKAVLYIPQMRRIPVSLLRKASEDQEQPPPPSFPHGDFRVVYNDPVVQVAIFRYRHSFGCSTSSTEYDCLPFPVMAHKDPAAFLRETKLRVGYRFLYGSEYEYTVKDGGKISIKDAHGCDRSQFESNRSKMFDLAVQLQAQYGSSYSVGVGALSGHDASHYSPFTGGEDDVYISMTESGTSAVSAVVVGGIPDQVQQQSESESTSDQETKPPMAQQSPRDVTLQLQAYMVLLCAHKLEHIVTCTPQDVESLQVLTCYGMQVGLSYPLKLLKLTMDFQDHELEFQELFKGPVGVFQGAYIDIRSTELCF